MLGCGTCAGVVVVAARVHQGGVGGRRGRLVGDDGQFGVLDPIFAAARRAVSGWSAATSATGSPWWRTLPWARTGVSWISRP